MADNTSYYLYQKYEKRGEQDPIPCYPNVYSVDGEGTKPLVIKSSADTECGAEDFITNWFAVSSYCVGVSKYETQEKGISYDNGDTWIYTGEYRDEMVEPYSEECGYIPPPPQYRTISGTPYCNQYNKYVDVYYQVSYNGGISWQTISTTSTLVETDSEDCGVIYRWQPSGETCVGYDKWEQSIKQKSYDNGTTWSNVVPLETSATTLIEEHSEDCGYSPISRWVRTNNTVCQEDYKVKIINNTTHQETIVPINSSTTLVSSEIWSNTDIRNTANTQNYTFIIGSYVKTIGDSCFNSGDYVDYEFDTNVECTISLPSTVTKLERRALWVNGEQTTKFNLIDLTNVEEPKQEVGYGDAGAQTFNGTTIKSIGGVGSGAELEIPSHWTGLTIGMFADLKGLKEIEIPNYIKKIDNYCFTMGIYSGSAVKLILNEGLEYIGMSAFDNVINGIFNIPNSVSYIDSHAFDNHTLSSTIPVKELREVTVGSGCTFIGYCAFASCTLEFTGVGLHLRLVSDYLEKLTILAPTPPSLTKGGIFISDFYPDDISLSELKVKIYVPSGSVNAYKTNQYWSTYADIIYPI